MTPHPKVGGVAYVNEGIEDKLEKNSTALSESSSSSSGFGGDCELDIDEALEKHGGFGRFQAILLIILCFMVMTIGQHFVLSVFIGTDPPWRCVQNDTSTFCRTHFGKDVSSDSDLFKARCDLDRDEWEYTTKRDYSFVTEYELVCDKTAVAAFASSAFYMGGIIGSMVAGTAADRWGRKPVLLFSLGATFVASISCAFINAIWQLITIRMLLGAVNVSCYFTAFVVLSEYVTPRTRTMAANMFIMTLTLSHMALDLWANFERRWRSLQLYSSLPCLVPFVILLFLPESPRYLLSAKKTENAKEVLNKIGRINGVDMKDFKLKSLEVSAESSDKRYSYIDLISNCKVLFITLCTGMQWLTIGLVYYALALEASSLGGDMYATFALTACADLPSFLTSAYTCDRFGRKKSNLVSLIIGGLLVGSISIVPQDFKYKYIVNMVIVMVAKFFTENAFNGIYTWTFEIFPTVLRSQGVSVCVIFQRIGLLIVPFLTTVLQSVSYVLPFIFMFALSVGACLLGLTLPETNKKPTREAYDDFFESKVVMSSVNEGINNSDEKV